MTQVDSPNELSVSVGGCDIHLLSGGSGPPLIVLPDDLGSTDWIPFYELLAANNQVHVVAHPGYGKSTRPEWARDVRDLAALESALLDELGVESPAVVGLGLGGWLAAEMATQCRDRFSRLVLVAPAGLKPHDGEIYDQFLVRAPAHARARFADPAAFIAAYGAEPGLDLLEQWEMNREMTARIAWAPYLFSRTLPHLLPLLAAPALVLWGTGDAIIPPGEAERWAGLIPGARARLVEGAGHAMDLEQPDLLAQAVCEFLGEHASSKE